MPACPDPRAPKTSTRTIIQKDRVTIFPSLFEGKRLALSLTLHGQPVSCVGPGSGVGQGDGHVIISSDLSRFTH